MKKLLLLGFALCIGFYTNAQKQTKLPSHSVYKPEKMTKTISGNELTVIINETNSYVKSKPAKDLGAQIGSTWWDLQSNSDAGNRMIVYPDGTITAVWTMATEASWNSRGTGYNHSTDDGTNWLAQPISRLELVRTGWPNIGKLTNGTEISVTHNGSTGNLCWSNDGVNWASKPIGDAVLGLSWPRMVTNGNTIHVIGNTTTTTAYQGFTLGALIYMKSTDSGDNWTAPIMPTGLDTSNYPTHLGLNGTFSDAYSFATNGSTLAIVVGSAYTTPALIKSTNDGDTWSYTEILHLPIKKFLQDGGILYDIDGDGNQDYHYSSDGTNFVTIDNNGKCHVFFGSMKYTSDGATGSWIPQFGGMYYWNEDMGTINYQGRWRLDDQSVLRYEEVPDTINFPEITDIVDLNGNGLIDWPDNGSNFPLGLYYNSATSQPAAVITPDGSIFLFYSGIVEGTDGLVGTEHKAFRNIWEIHKLSNETNNFTWSAPVRIAEDDLTEEVWPCVSPVITGTSGSYYAHLWYQGDGYPGNSLQPNTGNPHPIIDNAIYYIKFELHDIGINEIDNEKYAPIIYPNPASKFVNIKYNLTEETNVTLGIFNMCGQQIMTTNKNVTSGEVNVTLNIETLPQGVYLIKSDIGNKTFTEKLLIK